MVPRTRDELKAWIFRDLGEPVIQVNLSDDQCEDAIDDALSFWQDYHFDGSKKIYIARALTQADVNTKQILLDPSIMAVTRIFRFSGDATSGSPDDIFNVDYQLRLNDLWDLSSVNMTGYVIARQYLSLIDDILNSDIQVRFKETEGTLWIDTAQYRLVVGDYIMIECYQRILPPSPGSFLSVAEQAAISAQIAANQANTTYGVAPTAQAPIQYNPGQSIWNNRVLRQLASAYSRLRWGRNLLKFQGVSLPGGVTVNGAEMMTDAKETIAQLQNDFIMNYQEPDEFFMY